jgi:hypothetical protein
MKYFCWFLLVFTSGVLATEQNNQIYDKGSQSKVDKLNKAVEILRDPTAMNSNFRRALSRLSNHDAVAPEQQSETIEATTELGLPEVELVGKVFSENRPATVILKAKGKIYHFEEGDKISRVINHEVVTFHVQEISRHAVRIFITPFEPLAKPIKPKNILSKMS